ncbi:MAG TPA: EAL domain-containing protein [Brevundimonas sp.]|jgi:EAL domain-containing protein (putative c-di-GMP-specific phosphodiesterase class I)|uniref:EAL domain-containing protein n=1 Tax=Brevundimonas sp. TaxID=1871086 RepID=UPI002E15B6F5|nr:EAL domain-containing protein [Brevundimonas sp.]
MTTRSQLLGLAFAAADLLVEVDRQGAIQLALGSSPCGKKPAEALIGEPVFERLDVAGQAELRRALAELQPGRRSAPLHLRLLCEGDMARKLVMRLFRLPEDEAGISCAITFEGPLEARSSLPPPPMLTPDAFLERTHRALMGPGEEPESLAVAFVDVLGLAEAGQDPATRARIQDRVETALQEASVDGASAARLTEERYALLRHADDERDLAAEVRDVGLSEGVDLDVRGSDIDLPGAAAPVQALRALRFAVESCLKEGGLERPDLAFTASLMKTLEEADRFRAMVRQRRFDLHFQPIVDLTTGSVTHFEALARFGNGGPAETLHMAEELALIEGFDLAVADKAISRLNQAGAGSLHLAVNVSGASLAGDAYVQSLLKLTAKTPAVRRRLIVEVTETAALADPAAANLRLATLRDAGIRVYIDDFGSGSAGFDYLRKLSVDAVKIDGSLITDFESDVRSRQVISHIVELCRSMSFKVVAERVETEACRLALVELGVDMAQGYLFGKPTAEPIQPRSPNAARRVGAVEAWG